MDSRDQPQTPKHKNIELQPYLEHAVSESPSHRQTSLKGFPSPPEYDFEEEGDHAMFDDNNNNMITVHFEKPHSRSQELDTITADSADLTSNRTQPLEPIVAPNEEYDYGLGKTDDAHLFDLITHNSNICDLPSAPGAAEIHSYPDINTPHKTDKVSLLYRYIAKPQFISPLLHFRIKQIFIRYDAKANGYIDIYDLKRELIYIFSHLSPEDRQVVDNELRENNPMFDLSVGVITIQFFYDIIYNSLYQKMYTNYTNLWNSNTPTPIVVPNNISTGSNAQNMGTSDGGIKVIKSTQMFYIYDVIDQTKQNHHKQLENTQNKKFDKDNGKKYQTRCCYFISKFFTCPFTTIPCFNFSCCLPSIAAKFGSTYYQYFKLLSSLLWLNILLACVACVLLIPAMVNFDWSFGPYNVVSWTDGHETTFEYTPLAEGFFFGKGMEYTWLFYSDYYFPSSPTATYELLGYKHIDIDILWMIIVAGIYLVSLFFVLGFIYNAIMITTKAITSANENAPTENPLNSHKRDSIMSSGHNNHNVGDKLITTIFSFDHHMQSKQSFQLQSLHLKSSLYQLSSTLREKQYQKQRFLQINKKYQLQFVRVLGVLLNAIFIIGCCVGIVYLSINQSEITTEINKATGDKNSTGRFISQWSVPCFITLLKLIVPYVVKFCVITIEQRDTQGTFAQVTARIFLSKIFFIFVVLFQALATSHSPETVDARVTCRFTIAGVTFYKMLASDTIVDFLLNIFLPLIFLLWRLFWYRCIKHGVYTEKLGAHPTYQEMEDNLYKTVLLTTKWDIFRDDFLVDEALIDSFYTQILIWVGLPFAPSICLLGVIYYILAYISRIIQLKFFSRMPRRTVAPYAQTNLINILLITSFAVALISFTTFSTSTTTCGPFYYNYNTSTPFQILTDVGQTVITSLSTITTAAVEATAFGPENSPLSGIIHRLNKLPAVFTTIFNSIGTPTVLICANLILIFISISFYQIYTGYQRDIEQVGLFLSHERSQFNQIRKQYAMSIEGEKSPLSSRSHGGIDDLNLSPSDNITYYIQQQKGKQLLGDFIQDLPETMRTSFLSYLTTQHYIDNILPLIMFNDNEIILLLTQWNPSLENSKSSLTIYILNLLHEYRTKFII